MSTTPYLIKAISLARDPVPVDVGLFEKEVIGLNAKISHLNDLERKMLPIEESARIGLEAEKKKLESQISQLYKQNVELKEASNLPYQILDQSVFKWRDKRGFPRLAPFSLDSSKCVICGSGSRDVLPTCFGSGRAYEDVRKVLEIQERNVAYVVSWILFLGLWGYGASSCISSFIHDPDVRMRHMLILGIVLSIIGTAVMAFLTTFLLIGLVIGPILSNWKKERFIAASFDGVIPENVRKVIKDAIDSKDFQEVFILAEVTEWKVARRALPMPIVRGDPLVVGWDGKYTRLIMAFDTTPLEQYIADEFAAKA